MDDVAQDVDINECSHQKPEVLSFIDAISAGIFLCLYSMLAFFHWLNPSISFIDWTKNKQISLLEPIDQNETSFQMNHLYGEVFITKKGNIGDCEKSVRKNFCFSNFYNSIQRLFFRSQFWVNKFLSVYLP